MPPWSIFQGLSRFHSVQLPSRNAKSDWKRYPIPHFTDSSHKTKLLANFLKLTSLIVIIGYENPFLLIYKKLEVLRDKPI